MARSVNGGYDDGYLCCPCFWGKTPASLLKSLLKYQASLKGLRILDIGCGEGKNSVYLAGLGATVDALDVSSNAIHNARKNWGVVRNVKWGVEDVRDIQFEPAYDIVVAYGLFHCLLDQVEILHTVSKLQNATVSGGYHVLCMFNSRRQEFQGAHAGFDPCLVDHETYLLAYSSWNTLVQSDQDLTERHPHNNITHTHSLTRILARKA